MELIIVMLTTLSLCLCMLFAPSVSLLLDPDTSSSPLQVDVAALPRKLKLTQDVKKQGIVRGKGFESNQKETPAGRLYHKEEEELLKTGDQGTTEGRAALDATDLLTMDYSKARKRRPIHNQSLPAARPRP
ncbi:hypothetical protein Ancab_020933 [Ancistrocladus abbreviatus]